MSRLSLTEAAYIAAAIWGVILIVGAAALGWVLFEVVAFLRPWLDRFF